MASLYGFVGPSSASQVATTAGVLTGVLVSSSGENGVAVYDSPSGSTSGTQMAEVTPNSGGGTNFVPLNVEFKTGLYVVTGNASATVSYVA
jgi:hypothetical protein